MTLKSNIYIEDEKVLYNICGVNDKTLRKIESISDCRLFTSGNELSIEGEQSELVIKLVNYLITISKNGGRIYSNLIELIFQELEENPNADLQEILNANITVNKVKKVFNPRTANQGFFIQLLKKKDLVFSYGPAGTGKTFLSVAYAMNELLNKNIKKVILTRPIVEAGESLGFLPGDYIQKINPYLVPLFDAMNQILDPDLYAKMSSQNMIEVAPLAYMRGRTFENCIVILDEAQNTTCKQMKMFLTRLGENAKLIVNGDITQVDLPRRVKSGLIEALELLRGIKEIGFIEFEQKDVVRHPIVKKIISAYSKNETF